MRPTQEYATFMLALDLGKTVRELLTGTPGPLTQMEHYLWQRWRLARKRLDIQRERRQKAEAATMG